MSLRKDKSMNNISDIKVISCEELKKKLDRGDNFKLGMTYHKHAFEAKHIPGSINVHSGESAEGLINPVDEIVVYCTNESSHASNVAYLVLEKNGFTNIRRFVVGLLTWEEAGYSLESDNVEKRIKPDNDFRF